MPQNPEAKEIVTAPTRVSDPDFQGETGRCHKMEPREVSGVSLGTFMSKSKY